MMSACWQILKQDKALLVFPFMSGICCLLLLASFAVPLYATDHWQPPGRDAAPAGQVAYYGVLFLFYLCNYFVVIFFNAAIIACATIRMGGGKPTVGDGFRAAAARLPVIAGLGGGVGHGRPDPAPDRGSLGNRWGGLWPACSGRPGRW